MTAKVVRRFKVNGGLVERAKVSHDQHADRDTLVYDMNAFAEENVSRRLDVELDVAEGAGI